MFKSIAQIRGRLLLLASIVIVTLGAGLYPRDYTFRNNVAWAADGNGIVFGVYGTAYTEPLVTKALSDQFARDGFTLEMVLSGLGNHQESFAFITQFYSGDDQAQLVLGQWSDHLIMMNGDDYSHRLRTPRISLKIPQSSMGEHLVTVTTGTNGSRLYLDGKLFSAKPELQLKIPGSPESARLVLGNSARGDSPWKGMVRGLAVYHRVLDEPAVEDHFNRWRDERGLPFAQVENPGVFIRFDEQHGLVARDHSGNGIDLHIPLRDVMLEKIFFASPFDQFEFNRSWVSDVVVNLFGFIPFGLVLSLVLYGTGVAGVRNLGIVMVSSAVLSGGIEFVQAWMPSRSSSALDLILNITGGFLGAFVLSRLVTHNSKARQADLSREPSRN